MPQNQRPRGRSTIQRRVGAGLRTRQSKYRAKAREFLSNFTEHDPQKRLIAMIAIVTMVIGLFITRLFYLQVVMGSEYLSQAQEQQFGKITIPAKRGEILVENPKTGELNKLATNTTLDLVYIDPQEIADKPMVAKALAPILFDEEDFLACKEDFRKCPSGGVQFDDAEVLLDALEKIKELEAKDNQDQEVEVEEVEEESDLDESFKKLKDTRTKEQLILAYEQDLLAKINKEEMDYAPLKYGASDDLMDAIAGLGIYGIEVVRKNKLIYADPTRVDQTRLTTHAKTLAPFLQESEEYIERMMTRRKVRYVPLKRRLTPEASEAIWELKKESYANYKSSPLVSVEINGSTVKQPSTPHYFKGVVLIPEHWRYYPEKELASTVIGYVDHEGFGRYGVEEKFHSELKGKDGVFWSRNDVTGAQLAFDASKMEDVKDGESLVLTIDRVIQMKVQELLKASVEKYNADSGTIVVMEPFTGEILAMGNYPNFDPNNFGEVYGLRKTDPKEWEVENLEKMEENIDVYPTQPVFIQTDEGEYEQVRYSFLKKETEDILIALERKRNGEKDIDPETGDEKEIEIPEPIDKYVYKNRFGLGAYVNRAVMSLYEPGSVFKPISVAIGLDAGEITPTETYREDGPIEIDTGTGRMQYIGNALNKYRGLQTMTNAIEESSNIGMSYVARKLGRSLFYKYITEFGFGDFTYIDLVGEQKGALTYWKKWPEAQLLTTSFGQGISVTPVQVATAWSALANGGVLMQPQLVKAIITAEGERKDHDPEVVRRVISETASQQISAMLVSSTENGVAEPGKVKGYRVAGKTGTSQMACSDSHRCQIGKYEKGPGTTITSFAGYGPIAKPKFVVLVKFERPRIGDNTWGSTTAAPVFRDLVEFLFQYYDVPPDDR